MENCYNWENSITVGPCENRPAGDQEWSYKPNGGIIEIKLRCGAVIDSITFKSVDEKGNIESSKRFGGDGGPNEHVVSFNWPKEYLTKLSGTLATYNGFPGIGSLCFQTNLKKYGPFGHTNGTPFGFNEKDGVIVGFHGRFGNYINTIGVYVKHSAELFRSSSQVQAVTPKQNCYNWENSITVGPCSNRPAGDHEWSYKPNGGIIEIRLRRGSVIDSITIKSVDEKGNIESSKRFGGDGGGTEHVISFNWPKEYLMKLSGTLATYDGFPGIGSLSFETNLKNYGPFGSTNDIPFEFNVKDGVIVGLHGRFGNYVNTIGVYIKHSAELFRSSTQLQTVTTKPVNTEMKMNMDMIRELGPWGGDTGKPWDDGAFVAIDRIDVHVRNGIVLGVQLRYENKDGKLIESKKHGGGNSEHGDTLYRMTLDRSSEYLVGIMGFYGPIEGNRGFKGVCSVSFYTNKGKYGPFGDEIGIFFCSSVSETDGKIIGFHGKSGVYLDALGVHMQYS